MKFHPINSLFFQHKRVTAGVVAGFIIFLLCICVWSPMQAEATPLKTGVRYYLQNVANSELVLDVADADLEGPGRGDDIIVWWNHSGTNQMFTLDEVETGVYLLRCAGNSEMVLDAEGAHPVKGAAISTWTENGGDNQKWTLVETEAGSGEYFVQNVSNPKLVLDASGENPKCGGKVTAWVNNGGANQKWKLIPVDSNDVAIAEVTFENTAVQYNSNPQQATLTVVIGGKTLTENTDYCVSYNGNNSSPKEVGEYAVSITGIGDYTGEQAVGTFEIYAPFVIDPEKIYLIRNAANSELYLTADPEADMIPSKNAEVYVAENADEAYQRFKFVEVSEGIYQLVNVANSDLVLDASDPEQDGPDRGAEVIVWESTGGTNQHWILEETAFNSKKFWIRCADNTDYVLDASGKVPKDGSSVTIWDVNNGENQMWVLEEYKAPEPKNPAVVLANAVTMEVGVPYKFHNYTNFDFVIDANGQVPVNGADTTLWTDNGGTNQMFFFDECTGYEGLPVYGLACYANPVLYLEATGTTPKQGAAIFVARDNSAENQLWYVEETSPGSGIYVIHNYANPDLVLDAEGVHPVNGSDITTWTENGGENQMWVLTPCNVISDGTITVSDLFHNYTGKELEATVSVTLNGKVLIQGKDYSVLYGESSARPTEPGEYTLSVKGIGNYQGLYDAGTFCIYEVPELSDGLQFVIKNIYNRNVAITVEDELPKLGSNVIVDTFENNGNQVFIFELLDDGYYLIRNYRSQNRVIDACGEEPSLGANVSVWTENGGSNQKWVIIPRDGGYLIANLSFLDFLLDASYTESDGVKPGADVVVWTENSGDNQLWTFEAIDAQDIVINAGETTSENFVLVIDVGHGGPDSGAVNGGVLEKNLNLILALNLMNELKKYDGIDVYLTRSTDASVAPGYPSANADLRARAQLALDVEADLVISMHCNYSDNAETNGSLAVVPYNCDYYYEECYVKGQQIGTLLVQALVDAGFSSRSLMTDITDIASLAYANGDAGDSYQIVRYCREAGILSIILEHGFMSNAEELAMLTNADIQKTIAENEAAAIVEYFQLTLKPYVDGATYSYENYSFSLETMVEYQLTNPYNDDPEALAEALNPDSAGKTDGTFMQFLVVANGYTGVTAEQIDAFLASTYKGRVGTLAGTGAVFVQAAKTYGLSEVYLLAHAILESGWGTSNLASGNYYDGTTEVRGELYPAGTYYNYFGIGATDNNAFSGGMNLAIINGWNSPEAAIMGAAKWISERYFCPSDPALKDIPQITLYDMRWYPMYSEIYGVRAWHQYATGYKWATDIANLMSRCYNFAGTTPKHAVYVIPQYEEAIPGIDYPLTYWTRDGEYKYVLQYSELEVYTEEQLDSLTIEQMYYGIAEMYAYHGYSFDDQAVADYFAGIGWESETSSMASVAEYFLSRDWYDPDDPETEFTAAEMANKATMEKLMADRLQAELQAEK